MENNNNSVLAQLRNR
jgi:hypothetical protein